MLQETVLQNEVRSTEVYLANWEKKSSTMFRWQCGILALLALSTYLIFIYLVRPQMIRTSVPSWFKLHPKMGADLGGLIMGRCVSDLTTTRTRIYRYQPSLGPLRTVLLCTMLCRAPAHHIDIGMLR